MLLLPKIGEASWHSSWLALASVEVVVLLKLLLVVLLLKQLPLSLLLLFFAVVIADSTLF